MGKLIALPGIRLLSWFWSATPRSAQIWVGNALGDFLRLVGFRRRVVEGNFAIAFANDQARDLRALQKSAYRHLGNLFLEILLVLAPGDRYLRWIQRHGRLIGLENWKAAKQLGKGVLFLSSHVGNWEVMASVGAVNDIDLLIVTKHLKPQWLHDAIEAGRWKCRVKATYEPRTLRDVLKQLKSGETVGVVLDQYMGPPIGVRVPFFGVPVGTSSALALFAKRTGAAVLPVVNYRGAKGEMIVEIGEPLKWRAFETHDREIAENTARYVEVVESDVLRHSDQWLWTHRRFKGDLEPLQPGEWNLGRLRRK